MNDIKERLNNSKIIVVEQSPKIPKREVFVTTKKLEFQEKSFHRGISSRDCK